MFRRSLGRSAALSQDPPVSRRATGSGVTQQDLPTATRTSRLYTETQRQAALEQIREYLRADYEEAYDADLRSISTSLHSKQPSQLQAQPQSETMTMTRSTDIKLAKTYDPKFPNKCIARRGTSPGRSSWNASSATSGAVRSDSKSVPFLQSRDIETTRPSIWVRTLESPAAGLCMPSNVYNIAIGYTTQIPICGPTSRSTMTSWMRL